MRLSSLTRCLRPRRTRGDSAPGDGKHVAEQILDQHRGARILLFLDGDHRYDTVRQELELARKIADGCVLVHDTFYQPNSTNNHDPYLAIQDFCQSFVAKHVVHLQTGLPGMSYLAVSFSSSG